MPMLDTYLVAVRRRGIIALLGSQPYNNQRAATSRAAKLTRTRTHTRRAYARTSTHHQRRWPCRSPPEVESSGKIACCIFDDATRRKPRRRTRTSASVVSEMRCSAGDAWDNQVGRRASHAFMNDVSSTCLRDGRGLADECWLVDRRPPPIPPPPSHSSSTPPSKLASDLTPTLREMR